MRVSEVSKSVYHYTTLGGLLGILQSQSLWCTQYSFMNDSSEVLLFKTRLVELLVPTIAKNYRKLCDGDPRAVRFFDQLGGLQKVAEQDTLAIVNAKYQVTGDDIYITSFCGKHSDAYVNDNGLLRRAYGTGGGFAVVFNTAQLEDLVGRGGRTVTNPAICQMSYTAMTRQGSNAS